MANEITVKAVLTAFKPSVMRSSIGKSVDGPTFTMTGSTYTEGSVLLTLGGLAVPLGQVAQPHWAFFFNCDATNFITLRSGAAGADLAKLLPGEPALIPLDPGCTPWAVPDTAACLLEYLILNL